MIYTSAGPQATNPDMSNSPSDPTAPRLTLKLKGPARKPTEAPAPRPAPKPAGKTQGKADAHWSDEYKRQMQEDMDKLVR